MRGNVAGNWRQFVILSSQTNTDLIIKIITSQVRIDHDWYYLAAQKGRDEDVILRRLPTQPTPFAQATDSSGLWRLHLVQVNSHRMPRHLVKHFTFLDEENSHTCKLAALPQPEPTTLSDTAAPRKHQKRRNSARDPRTGEYSLCRTKTGTADTHERTLSLCSISKCFTIKRDACSWRSRNPSGMGVKNTCKTWSVLILICVCSSVR